MHKKSTLEEQIQQALHSMDDHTPASPGPYLMTRINAAIAARRGSATTWDKVYAVITRPVIAFAGIVFILLLNILMISSYQDTDTIRFQADSNTDWQSYSTATNSDLYDIENNIEP